MSDTNFPTPSRQEHDADGRLIAAEFDSAAQPAAPDKPRWLLAIDGSAQALHTCQQVIHLNLASAQQGVDLINVQHWLSREAADSELLKRGWVASAAARAELDAAGVPWRLHVSMGEAADHIIQLANRLGSTGIAIGSHGQNTSKAVLLGSVTHNVLHHAKVSVLVVR
jgi:nucleotide-binding universal stress UspA family protein